MQKPKIPKDESERLKALEHLNILDSEGEERFDRFTRLAQRMFGVPIALLSLVDVNRQWFKSRQGLDVCETPRDISFCGHTILDDQPLVVRDATKDQRFDDNPLVTENPNIRFYAGYPLQGPGGKRIGTLCLIDRQPREFDAADIQALSDIGALVNAELSARLMAMTDELTGLSNRRGFELLATQALAQCQRNAQAATLIAIDMNGFKSINDSFGHAEGDLALQAFAGLMLKGFRGSDVVARLGGDEFCALLTGTASDDADIGVRRLREAVARYNAASNKDYDLDFSAGVASCTAAGNLAETLALADRKMYAEKQRSREAGSTRLTGITVREPKTAPLRVARRRG